MAGYRILHLIILCLGSVPDSLPSALARGVLQLSTNNQSYSRQNATGYEPDILQITTSEFELFPLRCNRTTKFSLYNISWWAGQVIRTLVGVQQDPMTISKTWHSVLLLIFSPFVSFLPFPSHILSWFISFFSFFRLYFLFFFFLNWTRERKYSQCFHMGILWIEFGFSVLCWACCGIVSLQHTADTLITWEQ